ncbi:MAG: hypothetical protein ACFB0C_15285 [Leptolyngbyaceae cyanobacterium]
MNSRLSSLIIGPIFVVLGCVVIYFIGDQATLDCQRFNSTQPDCTLTHASLRRTNVEAISQLQGADVIRSRDSDGDSTYQVILLTPKDEIPLASVRSSGARDKRQKAEQINQFLASPQQQTLTIVQDNRGLAYGLGGLFAVVGLGVIITSLMGLR